MATVSLTHNQINLLLDAIDDFIRDEMLKQPHNLGPTPIRRNKHGRRVLDIQEVEQKLLNAKGASP